MSHHHHHHDSCCSHGHHSCCCCCHEEVCEKPCHEEEECGDFGQQLLELADEAWMEVLKEKIKAHVAKNNGAHLEKLAKFVADSNKEKWKLKLAGKKACGTFKSKLAGFFDHE